MPHVNATTLFFKKNILFQVEITFTVLSQKFQCVCMTVCVFVYICVCVLQHTKSSNLRCRKVKFEHFLVVGHVWEGGVFRNITTLCNLHFYLVVTLQIALELRLNRKDASKWL